MDWAPVLNRALAHLEMRWGLTSSILDGTGSGVTRRYSYYHVAGWPAPPPCKACKAGVATLLCHRTYCSHCCRCPRCQLFRCAAVDTQMRAFEREAPAGADTGQRLKHAIVCFLAQGRLQGPPPAILVPVDFDGFLARATGLALPPDPGPAIRNELRGRPAPVLEETRPVMVDGTVDALVAAYRPGSSSDADARVLQLRCKGTSQVFALAPVLPLYDGDAALVDAALQEGTPHSFRLRLRQWHEQGCVSRTPAGSAGDGAGGAAAPAVAAGGAPSERQGWLIIDAPVRVLIFRHSTHGRIVELCGCSPSVSVVEGWMDMPTMSDSGALHAADVAV